MHMKITQKIVVPVLIALAHTASHAQINGQLFIVQRNQAVVKLALVTVSAYPEHEFNISLNKAKEENEKIISSISAELAETKEKAKAQEEAAASAKITLQLMNASAWPVETGCGAGSPAARMPRRACGTSGSAMPMSSGARWQRAWTRCRW